MFVFSKYFPRREQPRQARLTQVPTESEEVSEDSYFIWDRRYNKLRREVKKRLRKQRKNQISMPVILNLSGRVVYNEDANSDEELTVEPSYKPTCEMPRTGDTRMDDDINFCRSISHLPEKEYCERIIAHIEGGRNDRPVDLTQIHDEDTVIGF